MISTIQNINDIITFSKELITEGCNFHPDDDFHDFINTETKEPTYNFDDAELRNKLMQQCFQVCELERVDLYDITMEVFLKETGLDRFIPLPSQQIEE